MRPADRNGATSTTNAQIYRELARRYAQSVEQSTQAANSNKHHQLSYLV